MLNYYQFNHCPMQRRIQYQQKLIKNFNLIKISMMRLVQEIWSVEMRTYIYEFHVRLFFCRQKIKIQLEQEYANLRIGIRYCPKYY